MCFRDMTFCSASDRCATPDCGRRFTPEEQAEARRWWGSAQDGEQPPVAFADFSGRLCFTPLGDTAVGCPVLTEDPGEICDACDCHKRHGQTAEVGSAHPNSERTK